VGFLLILELLKMLQ